MYKSNSGFNAKTKVNKYKQGLYLSEKIVRVNTLLFL